MTQRKAEAIGFLFDRFNSPRGCESWLKGLDAIAELISPRGRLTAWARFNRAGRFIEYWWRGADMKTGGKFHRWVHGLEDSPMP